MYPTVNALMGLWEYLTAESIAVVDATDEVAAFLEAATLDDLFEPATWRELPALVQLRPDGDIVPVRAQYDGTDWQIGVNPLTTTEAVGPLWYTLADAVAAKLLGSQRDSDAVSPGIVRAIRFVPRGRQRELRAVALRGDVPIDPAHEDFFRRVIEERQRIKVRMNGTEADGERERMAGTEQFLKVLANSASYGIFVELNRKDGEQADCDVWAGGSEPFRCTVRDPEEPGAFFFPPLATLITGAARLVLALLERCVTDAGGSYAFCDTDSMAIVSSEPGGLIVCAGGPERLPDSRAAVRNTAALYQLPWANVRAIVDRFAALNPYDRRAVPGSVLKVEFDSLTVPTWAYSISAKRYALFRRNEPPHAGTASLADGVNLELVDAKAHGLGHVLAPDDAPDLPIGGEDTGPDSGGPKLKTWMRREWLAIVAEALADSGAVSEDSSAVSQPVEPSAYLSRPAVGRISVSSPDVLRAFRAYNTRKRYAAQVKPFGFLLAAHITPFGHPPGVDPAQFRLIAPFERDASRWERMRWFNLYDAGSATPGRDAATAHFSITTRQPESLVPGLVTVQTYADLLTAYRVHPEAKSAGLDGEPCSYQTRGLLARRMVVAVARRTIGKESNRLEAVAAGLVGSVEDVYTSYPDAGDAREALRRVLARLPHGQLSQRAGVSARQLREIIAGRETPHPRTRAALIAASAAIMRDALGRLGVPAREIPHEFDALAMLYTARLRTAQTTQEAQLRQLTDALGERGAAGVCGISKTTLHGYRAAGVPADPAVLARLSQQLQPYAARLAHLEQLQAEHALRSAERDALAAACATDPHTRRSAAAAAMERQREAARRECERLAGTRRRLRAQLRAAVRTMHAGRAA